MGADDLDDNLIYDEKIASGDEAGADELNDNLVYGSDIDSSENEDEKTDNKKRKLEDSDDENNDNDNIVEEEDNEEEKEEEDGNDNEEDNEISEEKKAKQEQEAKEKEALKKAKAKKKREEMKKKKRIRLEKEKLEQENEKKSKSDSEIFWSSIDGNNSVTQIEKDEINDGSFVNSSFSSEQRTLTNLSSYIKQVYPNWKKHLGKPPKESDYHGQPSVLVVTQSAIRAVEVIRALSEFSKYCKVGKLFSKHMKVKEQVEFLSKSVVKIAVGTPNRLIKLAENDSLNMNKLDLLVIDYNYKDSKNRNIFEIPEIRKDLLIFIKQYCIDRIKDQSQKIALY
ncbi:hypothetical protein BCR36DRAFT_343073 [Piromyces finnis]|uniref:P-loop containing nucleoside triphosphate hydrolase protein n=1 Tax=Piromyces finnis TaxID=1754191 RepID=A0A1Y1VL80_9FUNG|nr:hypothetical protein BCR36DRAFT_343073 [Piromyces finnis]|eukprot:ORX59228.1 hypothetical protein BCR36DRAFT_343073 [Piromyces finnis]